VDGISIAALVFDGERFADHQQSASLARAFRAVHGPDSTEYAGIHWYERWTDLSDSVYSPAVTYTPMFCGVMWANFLGPGHIEQFDRAMLTSSLPSQNCTWIDGRGLFLIAPASLAEIKAPDAEARLFALTDIFRAARRA
jgi:hypothetical protein